MARRRYGCAVVVENEKVTGVFTTVDALRLLGAPANVARAPSHRARRASWARPMTLLAAERKERLAHARTKRHGQSTGGWEVILDR